MRIDVVTLFPEMFSALRDYGVSGRAISRGIVELGLWNPRDYTEDRHRTVDDRPYGGGPGMVMQIQPLRGAINAARAVGRGQVVFLSPQGRRLDQAALEAFAQRDHLVLVAGRYEGVDERLIEMEVDEEWSIGDYVLSGGELAAMVLIDGIARLLPGALGHAGSAQHESFVRGLLDFPHYTRPEEYEGRRVPQVLLSGNHREIERWRLKESLGRTWRRRPELLVYEKLEAHEQVLLAEYIREQSQEKSS